MFETTNQMRLFRSSGFKWCDDLKSYHCRFCRNCPLQISLGTFNVSWIRNTRVLGTKKTVYLVQHQVQPGQSANRRKQVVCTALMFESTWIWMCLLAGHHCPDNRFTQKLVTDDLKKREMAMFESLRLLRKATKWGPQTIAKLVNITPISLWFMVRK